MPSDKKYTVGDEIKIYNHQSKPLLPKGLKWKFIETRSEVNLGWSPGGRLYIYFDVFMVEQDEQVKKFQDKKNECEAAIKREDFESAEQLIKDLGNLAIDDDDTKEKEKTDKECQRKKQLKLFKTKKNECEDAIKQEYFELAEQLISDLKNLAIEDDSEEEKIKDMESRLSRLKINFKQEQQEHREEVQQHHQSLSGSLTIGQDESMSNENEQEEDDFSKAIPISVIFQIKKLSNLYKYDDTTLQEQQCYEKEQEIKYSNNKLH